MFDVSTMEPAVEVAVAAVEVEVVLTAAMLDVEVDVAFLVEELDVAFEKDVLVDVTLAVVEVFIAEVEVALAVVEALLVDEVEVSSSPLHSSSTLKTSCCFLFSKRVAIKNSLASNRASRFGLEGIAAA